MAHYTTDHAAFGPATNPIGRFFAAIGNAMVAMSTANSRVHQVERLQAMSDEELSLRGLRREDIARHVFRDVIWM